MSAVGRRWTRLRWRGFSCCKADLYYSRFVRRSEGLAGFGYINRTGEILRLCGMALVSSARGTGAAGQLLDHLVNEGRSRGDKTMMLEVIEQNPRAVALYRRHGFQKVTRLFGWRRKPDAASGSNSSTLAQTSVAEALRTPFTREYPDYPWAISRHTFAKVESTVAFKTDGATVVISNPDVIPLRVHALLSESDNHDAYRDTLRAMLDRFAEREFFAPPVWPEEFGPTVFEPLGFVRERLSQLLMRLDL